MCGIVGAIAHRMITPVLLEGLRRLEYRGYDSAGIAALNEEGGIHRVRSLGKIKELESLLAKSPLEGKVA
jgi:glucosamine--fructose-6-phosphate aminotransferase (isomerizing)